MPGGKREPGETYRECAARELYEETGYHARLQNFIFQGPATFDDFWVMAFLTTTYEHPDDLLGKETDEGTVVVATWDDLFASKYRPYYELLYDVYQGLRR